MEIEPSEFVAKEESQPAVSKSQDHFNPVVLTDTVGAFFLGGITIILMAVVGGLLVHIRKLENQLREPGQSIK